MQIREISIFLDSRLFNILKLDFNDRSGASSGLCHRSPSQTTAWDLDLSEPCLSPQALGTWRLQWCPVLCTPGRWQEPAWSSLVQGLVGRRGAAPAGADGTSLRSVGTGTGIGRSRGSTSPGGCSGRWVTHGRVSSDTQAVTVGTGFSSYQHESLRPPTET